MFDFAQFYPLFVAGGAFLIILLIYNLRKPGSRKTQ